MWFMTMNGHFGLVLACTAILCTQLGFAHILWSLLQVLTFREILCVHVILIKMSETIVGFIKPLFLTGCALLQESQKLIFT